MLFFGVYFPGRPVRSKGYLHYVASQSIHLNFLEILTTLTYFNICNINSILRLFQDCIKKRQHNCDLFGHPCDGELDYF
jgi:hypothetical protein